MATALKQEGDFKWIGTDFIKPDGIDKVTGRAQFGADINLPGQLFGKTLRSPHAHAIIKRIDTSKAEALKGVRAVVVGKDFPELPRVYINAGEIVVNFQDMCHNMIARNKVLYDGHPVAAVAATTAKIARDALKLIEVEYEVLPHVIDPVEAMKPDAPLLHEGMITQDMEPKPEKPSNIARRLEISLGDSEKGLAASDQVFEREFNTKAVHQGYIEPHACVASVQEDGSAEVYTTTQGPFGKRSALSVLLGMELSKIRVIPTEIGGGFGGKTVVYEEPLAMALSKKAKRPVKMVMTRDEVFRATGPTSGANIRVKIGVTKDGKITGAEAELKYQAGAYEGSSVPMGARAAFSRYDIPNARVIGWDVVVNRPKVAAYRAPGAPVAIYAVESLVDEIAKTLGMDPIDFRLKNAAKEGVTSVHGVTWGPIGFIETLQASKAHPHYSAPLGPNQGRGIATGFWFNIGGDTCASMGINEDGSIALELGTIDIAGSRGSMAMVLAEELGIDPSLIRPTQGDTGTIGNNFVTAGSRVTFSASLAVIQAATKMKAELCKRAAMIWDVPEDAVVWEDGAARPASSNVGDFEPLTIQDLVRQASATGGPIGGHAQINAQGAGPGFATHMVDVEVDKETGKVDILRYTVVQDAGKAVHPGNVEGQMQGAASQGVGWALNEEYIYGEDGRLQNAGFLDYRMPVASDLPMIDTVIVEVPNPNHPYGVRGVGEVPLTPALGAIANAIESATGVRMTELPMSPPKVLKALEEASGK